ncbi:MAG TPA: hypothetical protein VGN00_20300 [Puia sp.]|jgi:hypothetical protein
MVKGSTVFLFGAGATLAWGSPSTQTLTKIIRTSGFRTTDNKTTITEFIFQKLLANGYQEWEVNFETIVNVIEELIVYYSYFNTEKKLPSLLSAFYHPLWETELFNFSTKDGKFEHGYKLQIPIGIDSDYMRASHHNESGPQFFFQHLLTILITNINAEISRYAYHTSGNPAIFDKGNDDLIQLFTNWMNSISKNSSLRLYTLNYDRLFKVLLERAGVPIFEGFDSEEYIAYTATLRPNIRRILSDTEGNIHYNLHGSAFWRVLPLDDYQLNNPELRLTTAPSLPINHDQSTLQIEKGKTIMLTNIVTGYQKAQKAMIVPFKQMQSMFDRDCCFTDTIYIIGYSFGDEHINASIKLAIRYNENVKVIIVDPFFIKNDKDSELIVSLFAYRNDLQMINCQKVEDNLYSYFNGAIVVYTLGFREFLQLKKDIGEL